MTDPNELILCDDGSQDDIQSMMDDHPAHEYPEDIDFRTTINTDEHGHSVTVFYNYAPCEWLEALIHDVAKALGVDSLGAGTVFAEPYTRDIEFGVFDDFAAADDFAKQMKTAYRLHLECDDIDPEQLTTET